MATIQDALRTCSSVANDPDSVVTSPGDGWVVAPNEDGALLSQHAAELGMATTQQIIDLFTSTVPATLAQARHAFQAGNKKLLVRAAHRLKSSASTVGMRSLADMAGKLEHVAR